MKLTITGSSPGFAALLPRFSQQQNHASPSPHSSPILVFWCLRTRMFFDFLIVLHIARQADHTRASWHGLIGCCRSLVWRASVVLAAVTGPFGEDEIRNLTLAHHRYLSGELVSRSQLCQLRPRRWNLFSEPLSCSMAGSEDAECGSWRPTYKLHHAPYWVRSSCEGARRWILVARSTLVNARELRWMSA